MEILDSLSNNALVPINQGGNQAYIPAGKFPAPLKTKGFSTVLTFEQDSQIVADLTGLSPTITLDPTNAVDGTIIILRAKTPTAVTFSGVNVESDSGSAAVDPTKMNVFVLIYFRDWDGNGTQKVIYTNKLYTV